MIGQAASGSLGCAPTARRGRRDDRAFAYMNNPIKIPVLALFVLCALRIAAAQTITGNVQNGSTGQPAAGDDVILIRLAQGMQEETRTKTGPDGEFTLPLKSPEAPYFVRVLHQGVNYDQTVTGTGPVKIEIYNAVNKIPGLAGSLGIVRVESVGTNLKIIEMYAISNTSNPPVTQSRPDNFEFTLPDRAEFDSVEVRSPRGIWVNVTPNLTSSGKGKYSINFPLRPGDTLIKVAYHLPYAGEITLHLHLAYPINKFGVMLPATMQFKALRPGTFKIVGGQGRKVAEAIASPLTGDVPAFQIIGKGNIPEGNFAAHVFWSGLERIRLISNINGQIQILESLP